MGRTVSKNKGTPHIWYQKIGEALQASRTDTSGAVSPVISQALSQYSRLLDFVDFTWSSHRLVAAMNFPVYVGLFVKWSVGAFLAFWVYLSCIYYNYGFLQPTVTKGVGEISAAYKIALSTSGQQDVIAFTTFIFSLIAGGTMGSILVGSYQYLKGYLSTQTRTLRTSGRRTLYDLIAIAIIMLAGGILFSLIFGLKLTSIYQTLFTGLGLVLLFSTSLSALVFLAFPHLGLRTLELLGFWRVNERERMALLREVIKFWLSRFQRESGSKATRICKRNCWKLR